MKMKNVANYVMLILIQLSIISLFFCNTKVLRHHSHYKEIDKNSQLFSFPNTNQASYLQNDSNQKEPNTGKNPLFSQSLLEIDPSKKITKSLFLETIKYAIYDLTKSGLEDIFNFIDVNKDENVTYKEWEDFVTLYVLPFEACNSKSADNFPSYSLDPDSLKKCFESDPKSKMIDFRRRDDKFKQLTQIVSTSGGSSVNFQGYFFLRKSMYAWMKCHSHKKFISSSSFTCAIKHLVSDKFLFKRGIDYMYKIGLKFQNYDNSLIELDFISFVKIAYYTNMFAVFGGFENELKKSQFLKAVSEDRLPSNFDKTEVELLYELIHRDQQDKHNRQTNKLDFEGFVFFIHLRKLFDRYSVSKPFQLSQEEVLKMLDDDEVPIKIILAIDKSFSSFTPENYTEASLVMQRLRTNERKFFTNFFERRKKIMRRNKKQDASSTSTLSTKDNTVNSSYYDKNHKNEKNREIFFGTFTDGENKFWTKKNFYRAFQLSNLYVSMGEMVSKNTPIVLDNKSLQCAIPSAEFVKLEKIYDEVHPCISQSQRNNQVLYKIFPPEISIDILVFLQLENFAGKVYSLVNAGSNNVNETQLKIILKSYGMGNMPDAVIDTARNGYDKLHRRVYDAKKTAMNILLVQAAASELVRTKHFADVNALTPNENIARSFPDVLRRQPGSPLV